jgi:hypothetical protein
MILAITCHYFSTFRLLLNLFFFCWHTTAEQVLLCFVGKRPHSGSSPNSRYCPADATRQNSSGGVGDRVGARGITAMWAFPHSFIENVFVFMFNG